MAKKPIGIGVNQNISVPGLGKTTVTKINFNLPDFTDKFQSAFDKSELQNIFLELVSRFILYPFIQLKTRNIPDLVMSKKEVFCGIMLRRKWLVISVRVDNYHISSNLLELTEINDKTMPGKRWLEFRVHTEDQIEESFRLIDEIYKISP